jgi:hypothetical protein
MPMKKLQAGGYHGSSNIKDVSYNAEAKRLTVTFMSGATYHYDGVPASVYAAISAAASPGGYFAAAIKDKFPTTKA